MNIYGIKYFYRKNAQGDVIALLDNNGNVVVKYVYDGWGNHATLCLNKNSKNELIFSDINDTTVTFHSDYIKYKNLAENNPFRYRSYYYDSETELYFLKTRYYDPEIGRFMTIDDTQYLAPDTINGLNLYAYCGNNPVMRTDPNGTKWWQWLVAIGVAVAVVAFSEMTAGAIIALAPAVANFASCAVFALGGSMALAGVASTAVSVGAVVLAGATIAIGINEGIGVVSGVNLLSNLMGETAYGMVRDTIGFAAAAFITAGSILPYPDTSTTQPSNLKEQLGLQSASSNPQKGTIIISSLQDKRMPGWLGWAKYSQSFTYHDECGFEITYQVHYVGNRFFPQWSPFLPWFDFKLKK